MNVLFVIKAQKNKGLQGLLIYLKINKYLINVLSIKCQII